MRIVYDAFSGWLLEKHGGNLSLVISERIALRLIGALKRLQIDDVTQAGLRIMEARATDSINHCEECERERDADLTLADLFLKE